MELGGHGFDGGCWGADYVLYTWAGYRIVMTVVTMS